MKHFLQSATSATLFLLGMFVLARAQSPAEMEAQRVKEKNAQLAARGQAVAAPVAVTGVYEKAQQAQMPAFQSTQKWVLTAVEAVAAPGNNPGTAALRSETESVKIDFPVMATWFEANSTGEVRLSNDKGLDMRARETRAGNQINWAAKKPGCEDCNKTLTLIAENESAAQKVWLLLSEDEGSPFSYRLTFKPANN